MIIVICCDYDNLSEILGSYFTTKEINISGIDSYLVRSYGEEVIFADAGVTKADVARTIGAIVNEYKNIDIDFLIGIGNIGYLSGAEEVIGNIIITKCAFQYDVDFSAIGFTPSVIPRINKGMFQSDMELVSLAQDAVRETGIPYFIEGTASADRFATGKRDMSLLRRKFEVESVDTEAAVIEEMGYIYDIPTIVLKGISNLVNKNAAKDYNSYYQIANSNALNAVINLVCLLVS